MVERAQAQTPQELDRKLLAWVLRGAGEAEFRAAHLGPAMDPSANQGRRRGYPRPDARILPEPSHRIRGGGPCSLGGVDDAILQISDPRRGPRGNRPNGQRGARKEPRSPRLPRPDPTVPRPRRADIAIGPAKVAWSLEALDQAVFGLPAGQFSQVLESENGYHIIRVIERQEARMVPFLEAQTEIKPKIKQWRTKEQLDADLLRLQQQTPVWTVFDDDPKPTQASASDETREPACAVREAGQITRLVQNGDWLPDFAGKRGVRGLCEGACPRFVRASTPLQADCPRRVAAPDSAP